MENLILFLLLRYVMGKVYEQSLPGSPVVKNYRRYIHPQTRAGGGTDVQVEIPNLGFLANAFQHAAILMADLRTQGTGAVQQFEAGSPCCFGCWIAKHFLGRLAPETNLPLFCDYEDGIGRVF